MTKNNKTILLIFITVILLFVFAAETMALEKCLMCHRKHDLIKTEETGRKISLFVDEEVLAQSMHKDKICTDCHSDIVDIPHKLVKKVNCRRCHYSGNPVGAPDGKLYDQYEHSVHGLAVQSGNQMAPVCQDCHGTHNIFQHDSTNSMFYTQNIPATCGKCHISIYATYSESVHGTALAAGNLDSPNCSSCHGEHNIKQHLDPDSKVYSTNLTKTCSDCHGAKGVVSKYGIKTDRTATFERSFHGVAQKMDSKIVANCASCHGVHNIRSENDPKSMIHPDNIPKTCGQVDCHPEATSAFATGQIHVDPKSEESGILYYISKAFLILTVTTLLGLLAFIFLDLFRRAKSSREKR